MKHFVTSLSMRIGMALVLVGALGVGAWALFGGSALSDDFTFHSPGPTFWHQVTGFVVRGEVVGVRDGVVTLEIEEKPWVSSFSMEGVAEEIRPKSEVAFDVEAGIPRGAVPRGETLIVMVYAKQAEDRSDWQADVFGLVNPDGSVEMRNDITGGLQEQLTEVAAHLGVSEEQAFSWLARDITEARQASQATGEMPADLGPAGNALADLIGFRR